MLKCCCSQQAFGLKLAGQLLQRRSEKHSCTHVKNCHISTCKHTYIAQRHTIGLQAVMNPPVQHRRSRTLYPLREPRLKGKPLILTDRIHFLTAHGCRGPIVCLCVSQGVRRQMFPSKGSRKGMQRRHVSCLCNGSTTSHHPCSKNLSQGASPSWMRKPERGSHNSVA